MPPGVHLSPSSHAPRASDVGFSPHPKGASDPAQSAAAPAPGLRGASRSRVPEGVRTHRARRAPARERMRRAIRARLPGRGGASSSTTQGVCRAVSTRTSEDAEMRRPSAYWAQGGEGQAAEGRTERGVRLARERGSTPIRAAHRGLISPPPPLQRCEGQADQGRTERGVQGCTRAREDAEVRRPTQPWGFHKTRQATPRGGIWVAHDVRPRAGPFRWA